MADIVNYAWRAISLGNHMVITRWGGCRVWGVLATVHPTHAQLAEAYGRAMWEWTTWRTTVGASFPEG